MGIVTLKNCAIIFNENNPNEDITIEDYKTGRAIKISPEEFLNFSQIFWKKWSLARVKLEVSGHKSKKLLPELEKKISKIADQLSYW
jgi:hypothetical protein